MISASVRTAIDTYVEYDGKLLKLFLYSRELPPLIAIGGTRAAVMMKILSDRFGGSIDNGVEIVRIVPLYAPAVLVWIVASIASKPSPDLLQALVNNTPRSTVDLIFELLDAKDGYRKNKPLIPFRKLYRASRIIVGILKLQNYPVEV